MNLVIDRGNTLIKFGIFDKRQHVLSDSTVFLDKQIINNITKTYHIDHIIISSVVKEGHPELISTLKNITSDIIDLTHKTPLPFKWNYKSKESIGKDRLAAVAGAIDLYQNDNLLVIDAGSAITYEVINRRHEFLGGNISPGMQMRFRALNEFTSRLPKLEEADGVPFIGNSTPAAQQAGDQNGIIHEIEGIIRELNNRYENLITIITGGDAEFFAGKLKNPIFVHPNLVLTGLNRILEYNAKQI